MLKTILVIVGVILLTIALVKIIDKFVPNKVKPVLVAALWILIAFLGYHTFMSVYGPIKFKKLKEERYTKVINNLKDIRKAQLAYRQVKGNFAGNFDDLVKFVDTGEFTLIQRKDSSILDVELTKRFGDIETFKDTVIVDTLGYTPVKDSIFKNSKRYKTMMNVPVEGTDAKFKMNAGFVRENDIDIPVFETFVKKSIILHDQDKHLVDIENQEISSIVGVKGDDIRIGSMEEVSTNGNWAKFYDKKGE